MTNLLATTLLVGLCTTMAMGQGERRIFEVEEFSLVGAEGDSRLVRYGTFHEQAQGWYAMEGSCRRQGAPGKGVVAVIHPHAGKRVLRLSLDEPLPPGQYKLFLSRTGPAWNDKTTIVRVRIADGTADFEWEWTRARFDWGQGMTVTLTRPAQTIEIEAVQFGGRGFGHLYDPPSRTIVLDQLYLTSDLTEATGPSIAGANVIAGDRAAPAEMISQPSEDYRAVNMLADPAPLTEPQIHPIALRAFDGRRNLLPNSSFELGGGDGWSNGNLSPRDQVHIFTQEDHLDGEGHHGRYALRLPGNGPVQFSRPMVMPEAGVYTLSGYVRALDGKPGEVKLGITPLDDEMGFQRPAIVAVGQTTDQWQRLTVTGQIPAGPVMLTVTGACLLDAVQLEAGEVASAYQPRAEIEASLTTAHLGHILHADEPLELVAWAHNSGTADGTATIDYRIINVREQVVDRGTVVIPVKAGETVSKRVPVDSTRGLFNVIYAAQGRPMAEGELVFAVLPPLPDEPARHQISSHMDDNAETYALMQRMGHTWQYYCKLGKARVLHINPRPGEYDWETARRSITLPYDYGMQTMPSFWAHVLPEHLRDPRLTAWEAYDDGGRLPTRNMRSQRHYPDLEAFKEYSRLVAEHLGDASAWWTIQDETEMYYSPTEFAKMLRAAMDGFEASGKDIKLALSCTGDFTEELLHEFDGQFPFAALGASSYDFEYWEARKVRYLQQRYDVPWFCIGVGVDRSPQFRRTAPFGEAVHSRAVDTAKNMVLATIVQDAKIIAHYAGRLWFRNSLNPRTFRFPLMDFDGTPLAHGYTYSAIPLLLAHAVPVEDVYLDDLRTMVFVFRQDDRLHAVTWSNNHPGLDIHWKNDPLTWKDLTLRGAAGKVTIADMYGNDRADEAPDSPLAVRSTAAGDVVFDLGEEPTFIFNRDMSDEAFLAMVRSITAAPRRLDMRLAFIPDGQGGVDLGVWTRNNTAVEAANLKLDANFPPNRMLSRTDWSLPSPDGVISDIPAGGETWGRIPTRITLEDYPQENATYTVWLTEPDGVEHRMYDTCWMTIAPRLQASIDGQVGPEWTGVSPAWMYYTHAWSRFGRHSVQLEANGEHFKYIRRTDARAAIYTSHDDRYLYVTIRCEDDDAIFSGDDADVLEIKLNPQPGYLEGTRTLTLRPRGEMVETSWDAQAESAPAVQTAMTVVETANDYGPYKIWTVDVAIPLDVIGGARSIGDAIGFDVVWHDADHDGDRIVTGTWRWAGRSTSLGTLFFGE